MIIWLNGPSGVEKSSVAQAVIDLLPDHEIIYLDADRYFPSYAMKNGGEVNPHSNIGFCQYFRNMIESYITSYQVILVDMKVAHDVSKAELIDYFTESGISFLHVILTADADTLQHRIKQDDKDIRPPSVKKENQNQISHTLQYFEEHFKETKHIDTSDRSVNNIANALIDLIK